MWLLVGFRLCICVACNLIKISDDVGLVVGCHSHSIVRALSSSGFQCLSTVALRLDGSNLVCEDEGPVRAKALELVGIGRIGRGVCCVQGLFVFFFGVWLQWFQLVTLRKRYRVHRVFSWHTAFHG